MYLGTALAHLLYSLPAPSPLSGSMSAAWSLFWYLGLAHWLADFPLQSDWMAQHKANMWVLLLHALIHFVVSLAVLYPATGFTWPFVLALAGTHFAIDALKNWLNLHRPAWGAWSYLVDQLLHMVSLALVAVWIGMSIREVPVAFPVWAAIIASGLLWITFVWGITERVLWRRSRSLPEDRAARPWKRLVFRTGLYAVVLLSRQALVPAALPLSVGLSYSASPAGKQTFWTDIVVSLIASGIVSLALPR
jgi:hypothetical protein